MKKRKIVRKICMITIALFICFGMVNLSSPTVGAQQIVLKAVTAFPKNNTWCLVVAPAIKKIEENTGGKVKINWLGGPEVIKTFDQPESLRRGVVDMAAAIPFGYFKSIMPVALAKGLSECNAWEERENGTYELWGKVFKEKANAKYLGWLGSRVKFNIYLNKKIEKLEDLKGLSIRASPLYVPFLKKLGASPVTMPPPDVYTGLQRGVVDGFIWPGFISSWGWHEVVKYVLTPGFFQADGANLINLDKWNKIPKDLQTVIIDSMKELEYSTSEMILKELEKEKAIIKKAGVKEIVLSPDEAKKFHDIAYGETWKTAIKFDPTYGPQFRELTSPCKK